MPSITVHPLCPERSSSVPNPLPKLLQTPSGLAIVEIQGTIHTPTATESQNAGETLAGKLVFPNFSNQNPPEDQSWMKRVYFYVGKHQRLTGEVKKLGKPIGVLRKKEMGDAMEVDGEEQLEVREIIRYKIVFSQRPEPVSAD
ncbi:hypothetical protein NA57DRAFT_48738 [Rhizodiscina lignyota]|uniref:Chromosome transmission fidelity protein 8 n=1 Tax=Rhizodiscina lignyota TaxID=1504668 RepID=A0A9P4I7J5_9PEZI|nr:hypothetical protein NA57DRAFT_48738 [Rhizodiscina lignyota]